MTISFETDYYIFEKDIHEFIDTWARMAAERFRREDRADWRDIVKKRFRANEPETLGGAVVSKEFYPLKNRALRAKK